MGSNYPQEGHGKGHCLPHVSLSQVVPGKEGGANGGQEKNHVDVYPGFSFFLFLGYVNFIISTLWTYKGNKSQFIQFFYQFLETVGVIISHQKVRPFLTTIPIGKSDYWKIVGN